MLNTNQQQKALKVWEAYQKSDKTFINANSKTSQDEIDRQRNDIIKMARLNLMNYLTGKILLQDFKTENDGLNKKNSLWGFRGINGQMYFNMLFNSSSATGKLEKFDVVLKESIKEPKDIDDAKRKISLLAELSDSLGNYVADKKTAPRTGSINFFITYFWQIQNHNKWPIFYKSMVDVFQDLDLWTPSWDYPKDYEEFYELNNELIKLFSDKNQTLSYWDIEHAFWIWAQKTDDSVGKINEDKPIDKLVTTLPNSFIPPVVSIIPQLALNDESIERLCNESGISVPKAFEEKISILLRMLGYNVESLGQGYGRVHDGTAVCNEFHYAIIFDAKVRKDGYSLGTDDRAIKEYIGVETDKLKRQGIRNVYFLVISSSFKGEFDEVIRSLKMETDIREVIFLEAPALLTMLDQKLRNPEIDLGPKGLQNLFAQSGVLTNNDVKEYLGI
jgi:hypothetical protein